MANAKQIDSTTQQFLDIFDITNNLVILKDGTSSLIITVDAMNFGLLAEEEQDSIMYAYAGLLNSLNYPIQIVVRSQTKDVTKYLRLLKDQEDIVVNPVQRQRIIKYREFVSNLIRERNVLDKKFYVVIPAKPIELGLLPVSSVVPGRGQTDVSTVDKSMIIEKAKSILEPKRDHLVAQFARLGLYSRQLETQEIIQVFYQSYNPEAFEGQSMDDSKSYTAPLVIASIEENNMDTQNTTLQNVASNDSVAQPVGDNQAPTPQPTMDVSAPAPEPALTPEPVLVTEPALTTEVGVDQMSAQQPAPASVSAYAPTQMTNAPMASAPTDSATVVETQTTTPIAEPQAVVSALDHTLAPENTPLPPAPELPTTNTAGSGTSIPQEIEIEIKHPSEKPSVEMSSAQAPQEPSAGSAVVMPPLPEIT